MHLNKHAIHSGRDRRPCEQRNKFWLPTTLLRRIWSASASG